jgi:hypothetical protein
MKPHDAELGRLLGNQFFDFVNCVDRGKFSSWLSATRVLVEVRALRKVFSANFYFHRRISAVFVAASTSNGASL